MSALLLWLVRGMLGLTALGWFVAILRILANWRLPRWRLSPEDAPAPKDVSISIVIPARNEAANLGACLDTACAQDHAGPLQIVVQDDASTDETAQILAAYAEKDARITALYAEQAALPEGWFGKPWAVQRAQQDATGDWLVFVDADVRLHPAAVSRAVGYALREKVDMVTGLGTLGAETFWEKALQPAVGGLILAGNDLDRVNDPTRKDDNLANGQFIAISRDAYDAIGGHSAVRQDILDDIGLARSLVAAGRTYRCLRMRELFSCRMYTGLHDLWEGWTKNLFAGMRYSWIHVFFALLFTFLFSVSGPFLLFLAAIGVLSGSEWWIWGALLTGLMQGARLMMDLLYRQPVLYGLTHAPANVMVMAMIIHSALRSRSGKVTWKGRTYQPTRAASADRND